MDNHSTKITDSLIPRLIYENFLQGIIHLVHTQNLPKN